MILTYGLVALVIYYTVKFICKFVCSSSEERENITGETRWFGSGPSQVEDETIHPFKISVPDEVLSDLKDRLKRTRFEDPLENSNFQYGFNTNYLRSVVKYWLSEYNWRSHEEDLNRHPHFKTKIEGIDVHFMHVKPVIPSDKQIRVLPILITHGWPGSFYEFHKMIPMLTTPDPGRNFVFEVICPSIPGYGFSEAPHQKGFNLRSTARVFVTLMGRLGFQQFYVQGGDWGSIISIVLGKYYPERVFGVHTNMYPYFPKSFDLLKAIAVSFFPSLVSEAEYKGFFPLKRKFLWLLRETGYMHLQSTKPDTLGVAITDSPAGMAAYILEKFSTWTNKANPDFPDGRLTEKFTLDELLTNVMIYWTSNNFTSSTRFYKENIGDRSHEKVPLLVPTGIACFPQELLISPRMFTSAQVKNLVSYNVMPRGGHFAAFEEPRLLADDIWQFVGLVEAGRGH